MAKKSPDEKQPRKKTFIKQPQYEGGTKALQKFVSENMLYPPEALEHKIQGDVQVKFDVDEHGAVVSAKVMRGIGYGCDEEALRVVRLLKYSPARNRGTHVTAHLDIVLHFRLPQVKAPVHRPAPPSPQQAQLNYTYVPANNQSASQPLSQPQTQRYTVVANLPAKTKKD